LIFDLEIELLKIVEWLTLGAVSNNSNAAPL
jgi:hypothetical protein